MKAVSLKGYLDDGVIHHLASETQSDHRESVHLCCFENRFAFHNNYFTQSHEVVEPLAENRIRDTE